MSRSGWILGKYMKERQIGTGAMGCAWLVQTRDGKSLVAKEINVQGMSSKDTAEAVQEADVLRQLQHPNIISMYEAFVDGPSLLIIMEFADAGDLAQVMPQLSIAFEHMPCPRQGITISFLS
jgi:serine/threonine protein kinase